MTENLYRYEPFKLFGSSFHHTFGAPKPRPCKK